jgi:hypothetical protein
MKSWHVIDGMPRLIGGAAETPADGACVMQYVSLLAGTRWTDHPRCTNATVAEVARTVNDYSMEGRREERLLPEVLRLLNAQGISETLRKRLQRMYIKADHEAGPFMGSLPSYRKWVRARKHDSREPLVRQWRDDMAEQYWLPLLKQMLDLIEEEKGRSGGHTSEEDLLRAEQLRLERAARSGSA